MNNEQRRQLHNQMVRAQLSAEEDAKKDRRLRRRQQQQVAQTQVMEHNPLVKWSVNNDEASSGSLTPSKDHVDDASPCD